MSLSGSIQNSKCGNERLVSAFLLLAIIYGWLPSLIVFHEALFKNTLPNFFWNFNL